MLTTKAENEKLKRTGPVVVVPLRDPAKAYRVVCSLRRLVDRYREDVLPSEFWTEGTYHPSPRFNNAYLFILRPSHPCNPVALARRAAKMLETKHGLKLDWAAGIRKSGSIWLLVKARAYKISDYKLSRYYPTKEDLLALRALVGAGRIRKRVKERKRER